MNFKLENINPIEIVTLLFSCVALWISWTGQNYVEATYASNQKVIIYSENEKEHPGVGKLSAIGDNKRILSIRILYPEKFKKSEDYVDSSGLFVPKSDINVIIAKILPKKLDDGDVSVMIPVKLLTRYAADGDSFYDNSVYFMTYKVNLKNDKDNNYKVKVYETQFDFASRIPDSIIYYLWISICGEDETLDINKMFETKNYWNSVGFIGKV
ncbi:TPA: hypothetical protein PXJ53_004061 [Yersinia enterocolitica]|uniref:hypothetical protein n=1 Tax=Yersinia TaxID=629 RepID=UPI0005DB876D|nr:MULTISPECIES: hypothetical protein [Yersinia]EKN3779379.1 hypothetical protein [Yersinia enterocolitica]EKN4011148.1 hypothetical protein [Yersinia enterocolitica]EKN4764264.1 hypothetical protein [Yersinia enterocolitica]EKN4822793.1 hypothetical protein [Yersinia enterocolitica]EKN5921770.1 hypothetical protein [Yersinia enterocolitica]